MKSAAGRPTIVFDVLGTLFSFTPAIEILTGLHPLTETENEEPGSALIEIGRGYATALVEDWFHSAQRDFTYLSMCGTYTPIAVVLATSLPRLLALHRLPLALAPRILGTIKSLPPRPSLASAHALLAPHFPLVAATNGGAVMTQGLLALALGRDSGDRWTVWSCDSIRQAKPSGAVYQDVLKAIVERGGRDTGNWFVASHSWDLHAARKAGFRTAFVTEEEGDPLNGLWGESDVVGKDLQEVARRILTLEGITM